MESLGKLYLALSQRYLLHDIISLKRKKKITGEGFVNDVNDLCDPINRFKSHLA
jgi:hypothetical protein